MSNGKDMIILLTAGLIKKISSQYFPSYSANSKSIKFKLDLSNYATKTYLKNLNAGTSSFALNTNLADLKIKVDRIDFDKINSTDALQGKNLVEQNYLVLEPEYRYLKITASASIFDTVTSWESKGLSDEKTFPQKISGTNLSPGFNYSNGESSAVFSLGKGLKQDKIVYKHGSIVNIYVVYNLHSGAKIIAGIDIYILFVAVTYAIKIDKYKYSGYGIAFGSKTYSHKDSGKDARDLKIFGADLSNSSHTENKKNNILVLGKNSIKLSNTTIQAEGELKTNRTIPGQKFALSLHYNDNGSYLFVNGVQQHKFKTKYNEIKSDELILGNITDQFSSVNTVFTDLNTNIYEV